MNNIEYFYSYIIENYNHNIVFIIGSIVVHVVGFIIIKPPFILLDYIPYVQKYKIDKKQKNNFTIQSILNSLLTIILYDFILFGALLIPFKLFNYQVSTPIPSITDLFISVALSYVVEDFLIYWMHRAFHTRILYKTIHKLHHKFISPNVLDTEVATPYEAILYGYLSFISISLYQKHIVTFWILFFIKVYEQSEFHCGYDLPFLPTNLFIPWWGGCKLHDSHHKIFNGNYAPIFTYLDKLFGTYKEV